MIIIFTIFSTVFEINVSVFVCAGWRMGVQKSITENTEMKLKTISDQTDSDTKTKQPINGPQNKWTDDLSCLYRTKNV